GKAGVLGQRKDRRGNSFTAGIGHYPDQARQRRDEAGSPRIQKPPPFRSGQQYHLSLAGMTFDEVRTIALSLPEVEEVTSWGVPSFKIHGQMFACIASHKSAEPET